MSRDTVCIISGLPIQDGDLVAAIPVRRARVDERAELLEWAPIGPALRGLYDAQVESLGALLDGNDGATLCAAAHGLRTSAELVTAIRRGLLPSDEPASPAAATTLALARLDAWEALLEIPLPMHAMSLEAGRDKEIFSQIAPLACKEAAAWAEAASELVAERETRMLRASPKELERLAEEPAWGSWDLPDSPHFDMIFHPSARQPGAKTHGRAFCAPAERRIWDQLPRMEWSAPRVEAACSQLAEVGAARAIMRMLGKTFEPVGSGPARSSTLGAWGAQLMWADRVRRIAKAKAFEPGSGDPKAVRERVMTEYESAELAEATSRGPRRAAL